MLITSNSSYPRKGYIFVKVQGHECRLYLEARFVQVEWIACLLQINIEIELRNLFVLQFHFGLSMKTSYLTESKITRLASRWNTGKPCYLKFG